MVPQKLDHTMEAADPTNLQFHTLLLYSIFRYKRTSPLGEYQSVLIADCEPNVNFAVYEANTFAVYTAA